MTVSIVNTYWKFRQHGMSKLWEVGFVLADDSTVVFGDWASKETARQAQAMIHANYIDGNPYP